jgi:uncharacterized protein YyaL (SSP411 family)
MVDQFWDAAEGGFFFTGRDHEALIARTKDPQDNAVPSGNSMAAMGLLRLAALTGRSDLRDRAEATLRFAAGLMAEHPSAAGQMLSALDFDLGPGQELAVVGAPDAEDSRRVLRAVRKGYRPNAVTAFLPLPGGTPGPVALLQDKVAVNSAATLYVCRGFACQAPAVGVEAAEAALARNEG